MKHRTECIDAVKWSDQLRAKKEGKKERENGLLGPPIGYKNKTKQQQKKTSPSNKERQDGKKRGPTQRESTEGRGG